MRLIVHCTSTHSLFWLGKLGQGLKGWILEEQLPGWILEEEAFPERRHLRSWLLERCWKWGEIVEISKMHWDEHWGSPRDCGQIHLGISVQLQSRNQHNFLPDFPRSPVIPLLGTRVREATQVVKSNWVKAVSHQFLSKSQHPDALLALAYSVVHVIVTEQAKLHCKGRSTSSYAF